MKKIFVITVMAAMISGGKLDSVFAQTRGFPDILLPLTHQLGFTNGIGFTNTVLQVTNLSSLQMSNVVSLLLELQTNIEELLPVVSDITSNATFSTPSRTPEIPGPVVPFTSSPTGVMASTLALSNNAFALLSSNVFSIKIGTNIFEVNPPTLQALLTIRDNLERTLPVLQMLNGTAPSQTNPPTTPVFPNSAPPLTNFPSFPLTNGTGLPLTNQSHIITNPSPF